MAERRSLFARKAFAALSFASSLKRSSGSKNFDPVVSGADGFFGIVSWCQRDGFLLGCFGFERGWLDLEVSMDSEWSKSM